MNLLRFVAVLALTVPASAATLKGGIKRAVFCGVQGPSSFTVGWDKNKKQAAIASQSVLDAAHEEFLSQSAAAGFEFVDGSGIAKALAGKGKTKASKSAVSAQSAVIAKVCPKAAPGETNARWIDEVRKLGADGWVILEAEVMPAGKKAMEGVHMQFAPMVFSIDDALVLDGPAKSNWGLRDLSTGDTVDSAKKSIQAKVPDAVKQAVGKLIKG